MCLTTREKEIRKKIPICPQSFIKKNRDVRGDLSYIDN